MTKRQYIDEILKINRSAKPEFLAKFSEKDLAEYFRHLGAAAVPRESLYRRPSGRAPADEPPAQPDPPIEYQQAEQAELAEQAEEVELVEQAELAEQAEQAEQAELVEQPEEAELAEPAPDEVVPPAESETPEPETVGAGLVRGTSDGVQETFLF